MRAKRLGGITVWIILAVSGCHKRVPVAATPSVPALPPPAVAALDQADRAFIAGQYDAANRGYQDYLNLAPSGSRRDQALFRLGLTYALSENRGPDWQSATAAFNQLENEYPQSPFRPPATLILSLRSEIDQLNSNTRERDLRIRQLSTELERLKNIDSERRSRP